MTKICSTCKIEKNKIDFSRNAYNKDGLHHRCKSCVKNHYNKNKDNILENKKEYRKKNKDKIKNKDKKYYQDNKDFLLKKAKDYYIDNKDECIEYQREYSKINKDAINIYLKNRKLKDPVFRLRKIFSSTIATVLKRNNSSKRGDSILNHFNYSFSDLKNHFENQFIVGMSWDNYGKYNAKTWYDNDPTTWTWNIDHIIPQYDLPYTSMEDDNFKKCWALDNLRPLWSKLNLLDGVTRIRHKKNEKIK